MIQQMQCAERGRLLKLYAEATRNLSHQTADLPTVARSHDASEFDQHWRACEAARRRCSQIRDAMYAHIERHQCGLRLAQSATTR